MTAFGLKLLAVLCMLLDHAAVVFLEAPLTAAGYEFLGNMLLGSPLAGQAILYTLLRLIGRLAFPIYAFQLAEGVRRTRDAKSYLLRLGAFALMSELPFDLALYGGQFTLAAQNIYWTLLLGAGAVLLYRRDWRVRWVKWLWPMLLALLAWFFRTDYGGYGVLVIFLFSMTMDDPRRRAAWLVAPLALQATAPLALLPINSYKGVQGPKARWLFYLFYPAHLLALYGIHLLLA